MSPQDASQVTEPWRRCGCGIGLRCRSNSTPSPGTSEDLGSWSQGCGVEAPGAYKVIPLGVRVDCRPLQTLKRAYRSSICLDTVGKPAGSTGFEEDSIFEEEACTALWAWIIPFFFPAYNHGTRKFPLQESNSSHSYSLCYS